jgi:hypothetical protein
LYSNFALALVVLSVEDEVVVVVVSDGFVVVPVVRIVVVGVVVVGVVVVVDVLSSSIRSSPLSATSYLHPSWRKTHHPSSVTARG